MVTMWIQSFRVYYMPDPPVFQAVHEVEAQIYFLTVLFPAAMTLEEAGSQFCFPCAHQ